LPKPALELDKGSPSAICIGPQPSFGLDKMQARDNDLVPSAVGGANRADAQRPSQQAQGAGHEDGQADDRQIQNWSHGGGG
jgi:hypothetical protein